MMSVATLKSNFHYTDLLVTSSSDELAGKLRGSYGLVANFCFKTTKFMSNVLEAISKLKLKNSKNHYCNLVIYLPAYSYTGI